MFNGANAESLCSKSSLTDGYALSSGVGANLAPVNNARPQSARTIYARDVAFPTEDPYSPVNNAGVPVSGYNAWPGYPYRLGRQYYGLAAIAEGKRLDGATGKEAAKIAKAMSKPSGFGGLGAFEPGWDAELGLPPAYGMPSGTTLPPIQQPNSGGGIDWNTFFGGLFKTLPGTVSAFTGKGDPLLRTSPQFQAYQQQYGAPPEGYTYNSSGQLVKDAANNITDFISNNPLLVGGAILAGVLLFMRPPGRR